MNKYPSIRMASAVALVLGAMTAQAIPQVSNVCVPEGHSGAKMRVSYDLADEPAVITFDICTNGVSIGAANVTGASGDVNRLVAPGTHRFVWNSDLSWPGHVVTNGAVTVVVTAWATNAPPTYMVVDLSGNGDVTFYEDLAQLPGGGLTNDRYRTTALVMRKIPARGVTWRMGSPTTEKGRGTDEVLHWVSLSEDYYMGIYPVTQKQFVTVMGSNPSQNIGDQNPVEKVRWGDDIMTYCGWPTNDKVEDWAFMGKLRKMAPFAFILPTEAQWEYACRAGEGRALYTGKDVTSSEKAFCPNVDEIGWFGDENIGANGNTTSTKPVGLKKPNAWGLYDMAGNVNEFCLDWYGTYEIPDDDSVVVDPKGAASGNRRVVRGGDWWYRASRARSAFRSSQAPATKGNTISFRVCCPATVSGN